MEHSVTALLGMEDFGEQLILIHIRLRVDYILGLVRDLLVRDLLDLVEDRGGLIDSNA